MEEAVQIYYHGKDYKYVSVLGQREKNQQGCLGSQHFKMCIISEEEVRVME